MTTATTPARELSGVEIARRQFAPPSAPAAKTSSPAVNRAQRQWDAALRAKFTARAAPRSRAELLDGLLVGMVQEPAAWLTGPEPKTADGWRAAADVCLAREIPALSPGERADIAGAVAEELAVNPPAPSPAAPLSGTSAPAASAAPAAGRKSSFLALVASGAVERLTRRSARPTLSAAAPAPTEGHASPGAVMPLPAAFCGPARLSLIQRARAGAAAMLGL